MGFETSRHEEHEQFMKTYEEGVASSPELHEHSQDLNRAQSEARCESDDIRTLAQGLDKGSSQLRGALGYFSTDRLRNLPPAVSGEADEISQQIVALMAKVDALKLTTQRANEGLTGHQRAVEEELRNAGWRDEK